MARIMGTLHEDLCTFMIIPHVSLLRIRNISDKSCRESHFIFSKFFSDYYALYDIMWKSVAETDRLWMTI
jgi:hypothetical protein